MMAVFRQEMKKIWRPGILLALVVIGVVYFWLWPSYYARHFGSSYTYDRYYCEATAELVRCFGQELEPEERDELVSMLGEAEAELNAELDMENNAPPEPVAEEKEDERPSLLAKLKEPIPLYEPKHQHQIKEACR